MPIYQRRVFALAKPLVGVKSEDNIFTIPHTGEQFKDEAEYRDRCELYAQEVWVCQCTGHTGLTHKEAWDSEHKIRNMLEASFPEFLHKPILSVVHHSTKSLDALIDEVLTLIHNRFHTGEVVICHKHDKARGAVVAVTDPENACNSPSSDKENKSGEPANGRFPPAHLPLRYTVRLEQSGRELANLTAAELSRAERLPNRDMLRLFVRSNAVRQGTSSTAPWVVSPHLFVQLGLKNKIASIFLPQSERKNGINSSLPPKKRKLVDAPKEKEKPSKKAKPSIDPPRTPSKSSAGAGAARVPAAGAPDSDSSDCEVLANIASSSKTKTVLSVTLSPKASECRSSLSVVLSPLRDAAPDTDSDDSDDVKLSVLAKSPTKKLSLTSGSPPAKKALFGKSSGTGKDGSKKKEKKPKDKEKKKKNKEGSQAKSDAKTKQTSSKEKKSPGRPKKDAKKQNAAAEKKPVGRPKKGDQKAMRQMSLFDLGKKVSATKVGDKPPSTPQKAGSPQKRPGSAQKSPAKRSVPPCVRRLVRLLDTGKKVLPSNSAVNTCVKWLTHQQIAAVEHERARQLIERRRAKLDEMRLMSRMSDAQKEEYLKMKKEEERRARITDNKKFFEDQTLQLSPLPAPAPVPLPAGLPPQLFGEAVMVAEFVHAYSPLLAPAGGAPPAARQLLLAVSGSRAHHRTLLDLVTMLLKALLSDGAAEGRRELSTPLRQVPVTPQTASELVRLALRPADADSDADSDVGDEHDEHLSESLLERLEQCELFELTTAERLEVLRVLVHRLLDTDSLADRHRELCLRRDAIARDLKAQRKEEEAAATAAAAPQPAAAEAGHPESPAPAAPPPDGADTSIGDGDDLASRTKRSRRNLEQARREREEREREKRERREKELEAERKALAEAALAREYQSLKAEAARVLRRAPLGRDRHHRRYWLLDSLPDALYVEAGWADRQTTEYRVQPATDHHTSSDEDDQPLTVVQRRSLIEKDQTTVPEPAENRWFCYTTLPELEQLRAALALKGEREAALREALAAHDERLRAALAAKPEPVPEKTSLTEATPASAEPAKNTRTTPTKPETPAETGDVEAGAVKAPAEAGIDSDNKTDVKVEADANANTESVRESQAEPDEPRPRTDPEPEAESGTAGSAGAAAAADQEAGGYQFLISTLKEDILGIEEELSAGWLGAVPEPSEWAERVLAAETADQLGAAVLECQRHIRRDVLQGPLAAGGQRWADAVRACRTLSRLHVLVGLLDSAIRWDLSTAQKKCRVCRRRGEGAVALCAVCKQLYHCNCLRPALLEVPGAEWQCYGCRPVPPTPRHGRRQRARRYVDDEPLYEEEDGEGEEEAPPPKEEECRVCTSADQEDMIFCTKCPAAFHKTCHEPPMLLRVRPGWECMDCKAPPRKRVRGRPVGPKPPLPSALLRQARASLSDGEQAEDEEEEDGEEEQEDEEEEAEEEEQEDEEDEEAEDEEDADEEAADQTEDGAPAAEDGSSPPEDGRSGRKRAPQRRPRPLLAEQDEVPAPSRSAGRRRRSVVSADTESEEERLIRQLSSDDEEAEPGGRRARRRPSLRRQHGARCRRQPRKRYTERSESDMEVSDGERRARRHPSPQRPAKPSPSKIELVQQAGAVCMYCDLPSSRRNELAVCQSCPSMYHRRCASAAGLVDAWQCRQCVLPAEHRARPVRPRISQDFEYEE